MARLNIDTGTLGNPATGDTLRTAMTKINTNFEEVYSLVRDGSSGLIATDVTNGDLKLQANGTGIIEVDQLQINNSSITPITTNADLTLTPNGTGNIVLDAITVSDNKISTNSSNADLELDASGTGTVKIKAPLVLVYSENDGSTTTIDITKPVAILEGLSSGADAVTYTVPDGLSKGQILYLVKGGDGSGSNVARHSSIDVTFGKLALNSGNIRTNETIDDIFTDTTAVRTCIWRGDGWSIDSTI